MLDPDVRRALGAFDARLVETLRAGDIRLLRSEWLLQQPDDYLLESRQDLEAREKAGATPTPLLSPEEAVEVVSRGNRSAGTLTYPWVTDAHPDPMGARKRILCSSLCEHRYIACVFIDQCCIYQHPPGGRRSDEEEASFQRGLQVMADLYASAIGTTVLQLKEIAPRPKEYDGLLALYGLKNGTDEAMLHRELSCFGTIVSIRVGGWPPAVVGFSKQETAEAALDVMRVGCAVCDAVAPYYKMLPYDIKGWCVMHQPPSKHISQWPLPFSNVLFYGAGATLRMQ